MATPITQPRRPPSDWMSPLPLLRLAWRNLWRHKTRMAAGLPGKKGHFGNYRDAHDPVHSCTP